MRSRTFYALVFRSSDLGASQSPNGICTETMFGVQYGDVPPGPASREGGIFASITDAPFCLPLNDCGGERHCWSIPELDLSHVTVERRSVSVRPSASRRRSFES